MVLGTIEVGSRLLLAGGVVQLGGWESIGHAWAKDGYALDPLLGWTWTPNSSADYPFETGTLTYQFNELGLRNRSLAEPPPPEEYRILSVGDSTAFGFGVEADETYCHRVETGLRSMTSVPVSVINAGVPGYTSYQCLEYLKHRGLLLKPDLVIMQSNFNDRRAVVPGTEPDSVAEFQRSWRQIQAHLILSPSNAYQLIRHYFFLDPMGDVDGTGRYTFRTFPIQEVRARVSPAQYEANIREIVQISRDAGAAVVLVGLPDNPVSSKMIRLGLQLLEEKSLKPAKRALDMALEEGLFGIMAQQELNRLYRGAGEFDRISLSIPATLPWRDKDGYTPTALSDSYIQVLVGVGEELGVPVVVLDSQGSPPGDLYMDYIHLNVAGHQRMGEQLAASIEEMAGFAALPRIGGGSQGGVEAGTNSP
jgi:lysophospholipase L1-like esterase